MSSRPDWLLSVASAMPQFPATTDNSAICLLSRGGGLGRVHRGRYPRFEDQRLLERERRYCRGTSAARGLAMLSCRLWEGPGTAHRSRRVPDRLSSKPEL